MKGGGTARPAQLWPGNLVLAGTYKGGYRWGVIIEIDWEEETVYLADQDGTEFESKVGLISPA